ncbi:MAG: hypothetical protein M3295_08440 [Chloroflexota bacterium]|nr:hypothetical protein [Chloroflexota bacterium]
MSESSLHDAFEHHVWATLRLIDACLNLTEEQLRTPVPGTYGSILDTMRHTVGADCSYLALLSGERVARIDEDAMDLRELRAAMEPNAAEWARVLSDGRDPNTMITRHRDDGTESHAPLGIRLAQAVHHGTDHRSQVCTALTTLRVEPPEIDVWAFAAEAGLVTETPSRA